MAQIAAFKVPCWIRWEELMTEVVWFVLALVAYIGLGLWIARFLSTKWHPHE